MIVFPNCKINLGLRVIRKRNDGFHDLESVFYPLLFNDALEVIKATDASGFALNFTCSGLIIDGKTEHNLCIKAFELLKKDFSHLTALQLHLHKAIPVGSGLGGGSSDGAFTLKLLNQKFNLGLSTEKLLAYALQLGSDCPFFIINKPTFATGRGEILETVPLDLSAYKIVIIYPGIHIGTEWAFSQLKVADTYKVSDTLKPIDTWKEELKNDFEEPVFNQYPEIKKIKVDLYNSGAIYASLSGSGSTVYGIFKKDAKISNSFPQNYFVKVLPG